MPADIRKGQPFEVRAVVTNVFEPTAENDGEVTGTIRLTRRAGQTVETLAEQKVTLSPGKNVFPISNRIERPDFYEYETTFVPDDASSDVMTQNNRATAFTQVLGEGHVLLIEDWENPGEFDHLVDRLRTMNIQVTVQASNELFSSLAELQRYDSVVLANVPRSSGGESQVTNFSDSQIEMLVRNTQDMGCGLIMLGGPQSFGAGGWTNTELEKAMPVDFQIHNAKVVPVGALAMVMHASELAQGNFWQKKIGEEALNALGPQDYCGVIHWNGKEEWLWDNPQGLLKVGGNKRRMMALLGRMTPGDMPDFDPSLKVGRRQFSQLHRSRRQAHDRDQRRRPFAGQPSRVAGIPRPEDQDHHRRRGHAWTGRSPRTATHRPGHRRQVLRGEQSAGACHASFSVKPDESPGRWSRKASCSRSYAAATRSCKGSTGRRRRSAVLC